MARARRLSAVIEHEGDGCVATCPGPGVVSQGRTVEEARLNLVEAVERFLGWELIPAGMAQAAEC